MNLRDAEDLAFKLIAEWLPTGGWTFAWSKTKNSHGDCNYRTKTIRLSAHRTQLRTCEQVENTIRHEIAHALAGPNAKHGPEWKAWARRLGADPHRSNSEYDGAPPPFKWVATCGGCGRRFGRHRLTKVLASGIGQCNACVMGNGGYRDDRFKLVFVEQR